MSSVFQRYFTFDPGTTALLAIESVNVLDLNPPAAIQGIGTAVVLLTAELDDGPYLAPTQVLSSSDFPNVWGGLGYTVNGNQSQYPCAQTRYADAQPNAEYWNGNGFLAINGKTFGGLVITRVNTSTGSVLFNYLAYVTGATSFTYPMTSGNSISLNLGAGAIVSTFTGTPATVTGTGATYASLAGGTAVLAYDGNPNFTVFFQAGDTTAAAAVARINQYAGFTFATVATGQIKLTGIQGGTGGSVDVISGTTGVLTALGLTAALTAGTGNVANIAQVKFSEVQSIVQTALSSDVAVYLDSTGALNIANTETPATGTIAVTAVTATSLGFTVGQAGNAATQAATAAGNGATIPAGTVVSDGGSNTFVTTQTTPITATIGAGPYTIPVRYAVDNTASGNAGVAPGAVTTIVTQPLSGAFAVSNVLPIAAQMSEAQIDAAYVAALATSVNLNSVAKTANISWAARHSNAVRTAMKNNAIAATAGGCYGRVACVSPPLNTPSATALSSVAAPGVGAYRADRLIYCYIGANVFVPQIAAVGLSGGAGFTATGNIDQTSDGWMACILSNLPPEENPGQDTAFTGAVNSIELGSNVQNFQIGDYEAFKAAGIAALRFDTDNAIAIFQSGVTSVNPLINPGLVRISRRRMADFIQGSISAFSTGFGKRLSTKQRRIALASEITAFLDGLLGANQPGTQRINGYTVDPFTGNTPTLLQQGLYRIIINVQTLVSLDSIVLATTIGDQVAVTVELPAAA